MQRSAPFVDFLSAGTTTADGDLRGRTLLLCQGIINSLDESKDFLPFFYIDVRHGRLAYQHSTWALDDSTFRNVSALARAYRMTREESLLPFLRLMANNAVHSLEIGGGVNAAGDRALMHNMSRGLMALSAMAQIEDPQPWVRRLRGFLTRLLDIYSTPGWETGQEFVLASRSWRSTEPSPATCGRTIGGLVRCYQVSGDERALDLARRFVRLNLSCFDEEGGLLPSAGEHFHSIADTVQGMLFFALLTADKPLLERCQAIYHKGLKPHGLDATGWFAEHVHWPANRHTARNDGEICCTANMISCALLLGRAGHTQGFEDAERYIRNMLLASQLLDLSSVKMPDHEPRWPEFRRRLVGNVAGFPSSCGAFDPTSPHLTQLCCPAQAIEALCDAWDAAIVAEADAVKINLLFSRQHERLALTSQLPAVGQIVLHLKADAKVLVKAPSWSPADSYGLSASGPAGSAVPTVDSDGYLRLGSCRQDQRIIFDFHLPRLQSTEGGCLQRPVGFHWLGNTIIAAEDAPGLLPLYADRRHLLPTGARSIATDVCQGASRDRRVWP